MGTRDSETSPKRTDQSEAIESNRKWQSIDLIPPPKVPTTTELKDEQQDFPVQVGVARPGWRGQIQSRSAIRQGRVPREQRKHHWSCVPDADGGLERWHHGQVRDLGYCWPGEVQFACSHVLPRRPSRPGSLRHHQRRFVRAGQGVGEGAADAGSGEDDHRAGGQQERSRGRRPLHGNLGQDRPERERNLRVHRKHASQEASQGARSPRQRVRGEGGPQADQEGWLLLLKPSSSSAAVGYTAPPLRIHSTSSASYSASPLLLPFFTFFRSLLVRARALCTYPLRTHNDNNAT